ncbi:hypothetical protein HBI12_092230 [Parastagonospora nodorum]|nr:hypothetical protein HBI12_092230 [Parastagonospora nodorum]
MNSLATPQDSIMNQGDDPEIIPACRTCNGPLQHGTDTRKVNGLFWTNCKACRDIHAAARRKKRAAGDYVAFAILGGGISKKRKVATPQKEPTPPQDPDCSICADTFKIQDLVSLCGCSHEPEVCQECFLGWLTQEMDSTAWDRIACPSSVCEKMISHEDVRANAPADIFNRFDELSMRSFLSADAQFRYCLSPSCNSGQVHNSGAEGYIFCCVACGFRACTIHDAAFHEGETCGQFDERIKREEERQAEEDRQAEKERVARELRKQQEAQSEEEVKRCAMVCPGCQTPIQKISGCDHMTCRKCRFEFCYICRAPYNGPGGIHRIGNSAHVAGCRYSPNRLPNYEGHLRDEV